MKSKSLDGEIRMLARENGKPFREIRSRFNEIRELLEKSNPNQDYKLHESRALEIIKGIYNVKRCE